MLQSLALIFLIGFAASALARRLKIPGLVGLLLTGILLGPHGLNLLEPPFMALSTDIRQIALIIILLKAGLSLDLADLKKVGRPAILMSFVPASFEILGYTVLAHWILGIDFISAALMGTVLGAVSPAVVVPHMVQLMDEGYGTKKSIPQLILAGASCDDIYVIVLFTTFLGMAKGEKANLASLANVPISVILGILCGALLGYALAWGFEALHHRGQSIRNSNKVILLLGLACLLITAEHLLAGHVAFSGLLAITAMAVLIKRSASPAVSSSLANKFGRLWLAAEILLFVLVGAAVDLRYTLAAGPKALALIALALVVRSLGVLLAISKTPFSRREKLFIILAYLPKATVQAAIGALPLAAGLATGPIILSVAVLSILTTAPLGACLISLTYKKLLEHEAPLPVAQ